VGALDALLFSSLWVAAAAAALATGTGAALCGLVGHVVILYRPHPEKPKISLAPL